MLQNVGFGDLFSLDLFTRLFLTTK